MKCYFNVKRITALAHLLNANRTISVFVTSIIFIMTVAIVATVIAFRALKAISSGLSGHIE